MTGQESVAFWATTLLLAASFFMTLLSLVFGKPRPFRLAFVMLVLALVSLTVFGVIRWVRTEHPPFVSLFESMITSVWFVLVLFVALRGFQPRTAILLMPVSAITFLLMGWSSSLPTEGTPLSAALQNVWLFIHASFATFGAAAFLVAASFGAIYLLGEERLEAVRRTIAVIPDRRALPNSLTNFMIFGLILWGVMIVSGAIWANVAWGRYWAWDPIELWSLISWLLYGVLVHARLAFQLPVRLYCGFSIGAAVIVAFSLWGVHYVYETIHTYG